MKNLRNIPRLLATVCLIASARGAEFEWGDILCNCKSTFDSTRYTRAQLTGTRDYLINSPGIQTQGTALRPEEIKTIAPDSLNAECSARLTELRDSALVSTPFWNGIRDKTIREIKETCFLRRLTITAYKQPEALYEHPASRGACKKYIDALVAGGNVLLETWHVLHEKNKANNGYPNKLEETYRKRRTSKKKMDWARVEVMMYGWWNCANRTIYHMEDDGSMSRAFEKLFIKTDCDCDEP